VVVIAEEPGVHAVVAQRCLDSGEVHA
jgi:hypothetical protein